MQKQTAGEISVPNDNYIKQVTRLGISRPTLGRNSSEKKIEIFIEFAIINAVHIKDGNNKSTQGDKCEEKAGFVCACVVLGTNFICAKNVRRNEGTYEK